MSELPFKTKLKIRFLVGFRDGTLFPDEYVKPNAEKEVTARELQMIRQSGAKVEVVGNVIPPPKKTTEKPPE